MKSLNSYILESQQSAKDIYKELIDKNNFSFDRNGVPIVTGKSKYAMYDLFKRLIKVAGKNNELDCGKKFYVNYRIAGIFIDKDNVVKIKCYWGDDVKIVYLLPLLGREDKQNIGGPMSAEVKLEHFWDYFKTMIKPNLR